MADKPADQGFCVDNGELDGFTPQQIFVLGFEYGEIRMKLLNGEPFSRPFHSDNEKRVRVLLEAFSVLNFSIEVHDDWPTLHYYGALR